MIQGVAAEWSFSSLSAETAFLEQNKVSKHQLNAVILTSYGVFRYSFPRVTDNVKTP